MQIPASYCQPLGMVRASDTLPWFPMWSTWLFGVYANLPLPSTIWTSTSYSIWALRPCSPPTTGDSLGSSHCPQSKHSNMTRTALQPLVITLRGAWERFIEPTEFFVLLTPTLLRTFIPAFSLDNAYGFEKPNPLLHHMDDLKAVLLNCFLINWLSGCQARSLKAESLHCLTCLLLRPTMANYKHL